MSSELKRPPALDLQQRRCFCRSGSALSGRWRSKIKARAENQHSVYWGEKFHCM